ncbi:tetratricopeptide repeat domain 13, partial [Homo sapiens]
MAPAGCCCCCCFWGGAVAAAGAARRVLLLLLLGVLSAGLRPGALATEHYSPLSLLKQELQHRQQQEAPAGGGGCSPQSGDWGDQYSAECGAIAYVLIGSGLYDEAIRHFSTMLQILSPLGRINEAVNDLTKAIQLQPSARLYRHRGTLYFISEDYATAHEDFQQSL